MGTKHLRIVFGVLLLIAASMMAPFAGVTPVPFMGTGTWDQGAPTTAYTAPGATWQFSFSLPGTLSSNPTTETTGFSYSLNGTVVATSLPGGVLFFPVSQGGGFDLYPTIDNASNVNVISLFFPNDVGSNLNIVGGTFLADIALNDGLLPGSGSGTVAIASTPEPPSIILLGTALLLGSGLIYLHQSPLGRQSSASPVLAGSRDSF